MPNSPDTMPDLISFPDYLESVTKPQYPKLPVSLYKLKDRGSVFGMKNNDLKRVLDVVRPLLVLPFSFYREKFVSRTVQTLLEEEYLPSLAAFIYFGYNSIFVQNQPEQPLETTLKSQYPRVMEAMPNIRAGILSHPEVVAKYPDIEVVISDPRLPDPQSKDVKVTLVRRPFNPLIMKDNADNNQTVQVPAKAADSLEITLLREKTTHESPFREQLYGQKDPSDKGVIEIDWKNVAKKRIL